jgi:hypothetical protein
MEEDQEEEEGWLTSSWEQLDVVFFQLEYAWNFIICHEPLIEGLFAMLPPWSLSEKGLFAMLPP